MKALDRIAMALCGFLVGGSAAFAQAIPTSYSWTSTGPIIAAQSDATHSIVAVKDPSPVYYNGQYLVYASDVNSAGEYNMEYLHFSDWSDASTATPYFLDDNPNLAGYHTAPQVFYFAPQNQWYLIYQSGQPQYSTNSDPTRPQNWSAPTNFFASMPSSVSSWLDFWVICDSVNCYLFFAGDNGNLYSSSTPIGNFPNGFGEPVVAYSEPNAFNLFEADNVYTVEGTGTYLANVECIGGPFGNRFFRALTATSLAGPWTPLGTTESFSTPFLGMDNVAFESGVAPWTDDFSSGGLVIDGNDQTDSINLDNLQFLFQGDEPNNGASSYNLIPWQLGLATSNANIPVPSATLSPSTITFAAETLGTSSAPQTVTLGNSGTGPLTLTSVAASGDFAVTQSCGGSVAAGGSCALSVTFKPSAGGARTGTIAITDNAPGSPQTVSLTGGGESFTVSPSAAALTISSPGQPATTAIQLAPIDGFTGSVNLTCAVTYQGQGSPADSPACLLTPSLANITAGANGSSTLAVSTTAATGAVAQPGIRSGAQIALAALCCILIVPWRRRPKGLLLTALLAAALAGLGGCGGSNRPSTSNPGTTLGDYTVTVSGTSGAATATASISLVLE